MALVRQSFTSSLQNFLAGSAALPIANGGTGAITAPAALTALGAAALGANTDITSLNAPALGAATATTATAGTNTTQIATTAFVTTAVAGKAASGANTDITSLSAPALGAATATTAAQGTATTQVATTAFVDRFYDIPRTTGGLTRGMCWAISTGFTLVTGAPAGSTYSIYNDSAASITVTQGSGMTLRLAGTTTTGSRTVAARSFATIWFNSTTEAVIMGNGVT